LAEPSSLFFSDECSPTPPESLAKTSVSDESASSNQAFGTIPANKPASTIQIPFKDCLCLPMRWFHTKNTSTTRDFEEAFFENIRNIGQTPHQSV